MLATPLAVLIVRPHQRWLPLLPVSATGPPRLFRAWFRRRAAADVAGVQDRVDDQAARTTA